MKKGGFFALKEVLKIKLVKIDDWENPSNDCEVLEYELLENKPQVLYIPNGFANGFKAIEEDSKLMILSNYGLNEIEDDHYRFDSANWVNWNI